MTCYGIVQHLHIPLLEILDLSGLDTQTETGILQDSCELIRQIVNFRYLLEFFVPAAVFCISLGTGHSSLALVPIRRALDSDTHSVGGSVTYNSLFPVFQRLRSSGR